MEKTKTKKALFMSVLSMVLCIAMLIGMTFAWFTDTASTGVNKIQAGKLDVGLQYATAWDADGNPTAWDNAEGKTLDFMKAAAAKGETVLWEPGCRYKLPELRIVNKENLALKYKILISGAKDATPDNGKNDLELLNVIDWTYTVDGAKYDLGTEKTLVAGTTDASYDILTVEGKMQESAGNEYQGMAIEGISITVVATQKDYESDSINNGYDKNATYPEAVTSVDSIRDAMESDASSVVLTDDITVEDGIQINVTKDKKIDFNGKTLTGTISSGSISSSDPSNNLVLSDSKNDGGYSIDGDIVIGAGGGMTQYAGISAWKPTVTVESGRYTHNNAVVHCQLQTSDPEAVGVIINGGTFDGKGAATVIYNVIGNVIVNNGTFNAKNDDDSKGECVYLSSGSQNVPTITTINGGTFNATDRIFLVKAGGTNYTQKIIVNGGTFNVGNGGVLITMKDSKGDAKDYLTINGGTFNVDPSDYVGTGHKATKNNDGTWTVK